MKARDVGRSRAKGDEIPSISRALGRGGSRVPSRVFTGTASETVGTRAFVPSSISWIFSFVPHLPFTPFILHLSSLVLNFLLAHLFFHSCLFYLLLLLSLSLSLSLSALCPPAFAASSSPFTAAFSSFPPPVSPERRYRAPSFRKIVQDHDDARGRQTKKRKLRGERRGG